MNDFSVYYAALCSTIVQANSSKVQWVIFFVSQERVNKFKNHLSNGLRPSTRLKQPAAVELKIMNTDVDIH